MDLLVCGLGNPGARYERTRHNVGFDVVERIAESAGTRFRKRIFRPYRTCIVEDTGAKIHLIEPWTYMNRSGDVLPALLDKYHLDVTSLVVVFDTLDLPPGSCRMRLRGSSGGHRGIASIIDALGTSEFIRFSIGIGHPGSKELVRDYVLERPSDFDRKPIETCIDRTASAIPEIAAQGIDAVMQSFNRNG